jgi:hypothetical protein
MPFKKSDRFRIIREQNHAHNDGSQPRLDDRYVEQDPIPRRTPNPALPKKTPMSTERKYFEVIPDVGLSGPPLVWVNESTIMSATGLPDQLSPFYGHKFVETPKITFDRRAKRGKLVDVYIYAFNLWWVSDRLKQALERVDPGAFAFLPTEVDYGHFPEPGPAYWLCDPVRRLDCIDDDHSEFTLQSQVDFKAYRALIDIKMRPEVVGDAHAFRLVHGGARLVVDDILVNALKTEKIRAWHFDAIQKD